MGKSEGEQQKCERGNDPEKAHALSLRTQEDCGSAARPMVQSKSRKETALSNACGSCTLQNFGCSLLGQPNHPNSGEVQESLVEFFDLGTVSQEILLALDGCLTHRGEFRELANGIEQRV